MSILALRRRDLFNRHDAEISVHRMPVQQSMGQHRHEFFEIAIILSGSAVHVTGKFRHRIGAGDVLIINSRRTHGYECNRNLNLVNILIREQLIRRLGRRMRQVPAFHSLFNFEPTRWQQREYKSRLTLTSKQLDEVTGWIDSLERETRLPTPENSLAAEAYLMLVINQLLKRHDQYESGPDRPEAKMGRLLGWLERHCHEPLTVGGVAQFAGMSERSLFRVFGEVVGQTPVEYLLHAKIWRAMDYLSDAQSALGISEVAAACGFEDSNYFSRCFRRVTGRSPREFRRENLRLHG